jgi:4-carboxymuconolactone decarboxylase
MEKQKFPKHYLTSKKKFKNFFNLIQLAAAAAIRSEGSVHSHTRRAIEAGAKPEEIYHTVILLTATIGFPTVAAALSWVDDVVGKKQGKS